MKVHLTPEAIGRVPEEDVFSGGLHSESDFRCLHFTLLECMASWGCLWEKGKGRQKSFPFGGKDCFFVGLGRKKFSFVSLGK